MKSDEIAITRRYYRSGESEYSINREPVRLKDVSELLMDTGLGRDGYSIIGQGRIDEIVSGRSVDRREIFEEAAGISRCRHRKEEAEHKLARTDENLQRVRDKIDELELQVGPLREQAETAKKYLLLRDELRSVEVSAWMETLDKLHAEAENAALASRQAEKALADARRELEELYGKSENIAEKMRECDVEAESERLKLSSAEAALNECENAAAVLRANIKNSFESVERLKSEMRDTASRAAELSGNIGERRARMEEIDARSGKLAGEERSLIEKARQNELGAGEAMREIAGLVAEEGIKSGELASLKAVMGMLEARKAELLERAGKLDGDLSEARRKLEETGAEGRKAAGALKEAREKTAGLGNVVSGRRMLISSRENAYKELSEKATKLTVECRSMDARIAMLTEMEKELEGYSGAVRAIVREAGRGALRGIRGPVAKLIKTDGRYALAVETALGGAMQHIVVDTQEEGRAAIELLKRRGAGRCTFLPIDVIKDRRRASAPTGEAGFVGIAADLTEREPRYNAIIEDLLGRTVVVETLSDAVRMSRKHDNALRIVTLDGPRARILRRLRSSRPSRKPRGP